MAKAKSKQTPEEQAKPQPGDINQVGTTMVTVEHIRTSHAEVVEDPRLVKVLIEYPQDYTGDRHLKQGKVYAVSPESAKIFIDKGIAKEVEN